MGYSKLPKFDRNQYQDTWYPITQNLAYNPARKKWRAYVVSKHSGSRQYLGQYPTRSAATNAYRKASRAQPADILPSQG